jgi:hypothetical protein
VNQHEPETGIRNTETAVRNVDKPPVVNTQSGKSTLPVLYALAGVPGGVSSDDTLIAAGAATAACAFRMAPIDRSSDSPSDSSSYCGPVIYVDSDTGCKSAPTAA